MIRDRTDIVQLIDAAHEAKAEPPRGHLGASILGRECRRSLWYGFRWAIHEVFTGRMLRLFQRGHDEEPRFVADLRRIGVEVHTINPATGKQFNWSALAGHSGGSQDAACRKVPGAPRDRWYLLEFKTHSNKSFVDLIGKGLHKSKPVHVDQMNLYMHWSGLRFALYLALNKDTDELYCVEVEYDEARALELIEKGGSIIFSDEPPPKITEDAASWLCTFCAAKPLCHGKKMPNVNCRTCSHVTPVKDGNDGAWQCELHNKRLSVDEQRAGCDSHVYNPHLLRNHGEYVSGNSELNYAEYRTPLGAVVRNGSRSPTALSSKELSGVADWNLLADPGMAELMAMRSREAILVSMIPHEEESNAI